MILFENTEQFFLLPAIGFVTDDDGIWLTVAFAYWGVSFRVCGFPGD